MLFGSSTGSSMFPSTPAVSPNPNKDVMITSPPEDTISAMEFSPASMSTQFLAAAGWSNNVQCWEVQANGTSIPKAQQSHTKPILDLCWSDDGSKIFTGSCDHTAKMWDLASNQAVQVAQHDAPIKTCHFIKAPNYTCLVTGSWDKTLKFWDLKCPTPMMSITLPEKCFCADVKYPLAVVGTAGKHICIFSLEDTPKLYKQAESPLKFMHRAISIFNDKKTGTPCGYTLGSIEGRVAIQYVSSQNPKDSFTFKCHRNSVNSSTQEIYPVNDMAFHPVHGTLATIGSDGKFSFWDKDARTKLKTSEDMGLSITSCCFNSQGTIFAYATGYDWAKGHAFYDPAKKPNIYFKDCFDDLKSNVKK